MASTSVPGLPGWGNLHAPALLGAYGRSPCHGGGLRAPFLFGSVVAVIAHHSRPRVWTSPCFLCPRMGAIPVQPRFLRSPRLLTRVCKPLPDGRAIPAP